MIGAPPATFTPADAPVSNVFFALGLALVFLRFSIFHQVVSYLLGVNLHLLYVIGLPALLGIVLTGRVYPAIQGRPALYWMAFTAWMAAAVPFSYWPGGSFAVFSDYVRTNLVMVFVIAGLTVTWRQCRWLMAAIAAAAATNLLTAELFQGDRYGNRLSLGVGAIADPNDFAAHLLLVLPFLLWIVVSGRLLPVRIAGLGAIGLGLFYILRTASRGALIGLTAEVLFFAIRGSMRQRIALALIAPVGIAALAVAVPRSSWERLLSISQDRGASEEAVESTETREYLLRKSIEYTFHNPIFGVGPGEFAEYEGVHNRRPGMTHGYWHETHNTLTQVSSECGIPAAIFFMAGVISTFRLLNSTYRKAKARADCLDIRRATFCAMLGYAGFCTATAFLNFAYFFYYPAMGGLAIAISRAAEQEFRTRGDKHAQPANVEVV